VDKGRRIALTPEERRLPMVIGVEAVASSVRCALEAMPDVEHQDDASSSRFSYFVKSQ
jgi:hypothetical protein